MSEVGAVEVPTSLTPGVLRTPRSAGVAGVLFAVLFGVIVFLIHKVVPANPRDAGAWLTQESGRSEVDVALALVPFCGIFFLWFMGAVRSRIGEVEDRFFSTVFLGSGLIFVAMMFVSTAIMGALITLAGLHGVVPPISVWELGRAATFNLAATFAMRMAAVFTLAASTIALRLRIHARVIVWFGYAAALILLLTASTLPWIELVFPLWVLVVSIDLLIQSYRCAGSPHLNHTRMMTTTSRAEEPRRAKRT
jgi:hypothetical protein